MDFCGHHRRSCVDRIISTWPLQHLVCNFRRRRTATLFGQSLAVASPEDVLLAKLEWNKITPSERQVNDAFGILLVQGPRLDRAYLHRWAAELGVEETLAELMRRFDEAQPLFIRIYALDAPFYRAWSCDFLLGECRRAAGKE